MYLSSTVENGVTNCRHDNVQTTIISALQLSFKFNSVTGAIKQIPFFPPHTLPLHKQREQMQTKTFSGHSLTENDRKIKILHHTAIADLYKSLNSKLPKFLFPFHCMISSQNLK